MDLAWHEYQLWQQNRWTTNTLGGLQRAQNYIDCTREYFSPKTAIHKRHARQSLRLIE